MDFIQFKVFYPIHLAILLMSTQKHHCNYSTRGLAIHPMLFSGKCYLVLSLFIVVQSLSFFCSDCAIGKNHKLSFSYSTSSLSTSLELVYYDVWDPASVSSHSGYKYYVLLVNEFTKHNWLFPLKVKSEVYSIFFQFKVYVENMVGNKIKTLRTYSGGKFTSFVFNYFLLAHSIVHQYSCPHTP